MFQQCNETQLLSKRIFFGLLGLVFCFFSGLILLTLPVPRTFYGLVYFGIPTTAYLGLAFVCFSHTRKVHRVSVERILLVVAGLLYFLLCILLSRVILDFPSVVGGLLLVVIVSLGITCIYRVVQTREVRVMDRILLAMTGLLCFLLSIYWWFASGYHGQSVLLHARNLKEWAVGLPVIVFALLGILYIYHSLIDLNDSHRPPVLKSKG